MAKTFEESVNTKVVADRLGVEESLIIDDLNMTVLEKEQNPYTKSDLSDVKTVLKTEGGANIDYVPVGSTKELAGCTITAREEEYTTGVLAWKQTNTRTIYHVESDYLGSFDYNPDEFTLGYKELEDGSQLPVLTYIGSNNGGKELSVLGADLIANGEDITIPRGIKHIDYMFTNNDTLKYIPTIPTSVESMHYTFADCDNLEFSVNDDGTVFDGISGKSGADDDRGTIGMMPSLDAGCVYLPEGLTDISGAFKGCSKLRVNFSTASQISGALGVTYVTGVNLPSGCVNITSMLDGCTALGENKFETLDSYPHYGKDITPYLTSTYAKDALNVSNEKAKEYADNVEFTVDEQGHVAKDTDTSNLDASALAAAQAATRLSYLEKIHNGEVESDAEVSSGNARSNNYYYNAKDNAIHDDITGQMVGDATPSAMSSLWQRLVIDGATGVGIDVAVRGLTGNKWAGRIAGVAGAVALDYFDVLDESLVPLCYWVIDKLPDGTIKDKLSEFTSMIAPSTIDEQKERLTAENLAATYQNRRLQRSIFGIQGTGEISSINESLYNNAEYCGQNLNFKATVDKALESGEASATNGARAVVHESVSSFAEYINSEAESGRDTAELSGLLKDYYVDLMTGLESYNKGAKHGIEQLTDSNYQDVSYKGLEMLNRAYADEVLSSLKELDATYNFMDNDAWTKIEALNITGIDIRNARNYNGTQYVALSEKSITEAKEIIEAAGESYATGIVIQTHDNQSFWNEGNGQFYNEGVSDDTVTQNRIAAAASIVESDDVDSSEDSIEESLVAET